MYDYDRRPFIARSGAGLAKAVALAAKAFEATGDLGPLIEACAAVKAVYDPTGQANGGIDYVNVPWLAHLSPIKRRNVLRLRDESVYMVSEFKREESKGWPYGKERALERLKKFLAGVKLLEAIIKSGDQEAPDLTVEGMKVVVLPGVTSEETQDALAALQEAADHLKGKFAKVLYGTVYLTPKLSGAAAQYVWDNDTMALSVRARKRFSDVYTLIHEFGHRYDNKFADRKLKFEFNDLSLRKVVETVTVDRGDLAAFADELVTIAVARRDGKPMPEWSEGLEQLMRFGPNDLVKPIRRTMAEVAAGRVEPESVRQLLDGQASVTYKTDKVLQEPVPVTPYGGTKLLENFAEAFAHTVLGMDMPPGYAEIMAKLT